jgi:hypothetical protein
MLCSWREHNTLQEQIKNKSAAVINGKRIQRNVRSHRKLTRWAVWNALFSPAASVNTARR